MGSVAEQFLAYLEPVIKCDYCYKNMGQALPIWGGLFEFPDGSNLYVSGHERKLSVYFSGYSYESLPEVFEADVKYLCSETELLDWLEKGGRPELKYAGNPQLAWQLSLMLAHARAHYKSNNHSWEKEVEEHLRKERAETLGNRV